MENQTTITLPMEVAQIAENVSVEKRNEVQEVLNHVFDGISKMREQLDAVTVIDENDKISMKMANTIRLGVRQVRLDAEKTFDAKRAEVQQQMLSHKTEDSLWLKAKQTMQILTKEIEETARWKEETRVRIEAEQKELRIQERIIKISKFDSTILRSEFEAMSDESFDRFLNGIEAEHNSKIEAAQKAEEERLTKIKADEEAREAQRLENERLKAEAEEKEKQLAIEKAKLEAERKESERKLAEERAKAKAESDRVEAENKAILKAKKEAEEKALAKAAQQNADAKKEAEKLAKAPIKKQLSTWVDNFKIEETTIESEKATLIKEKFEAFKVWAKKEIENL